ncbi:pilus assembly protein PilW [Vibrio metschnikovii]|uniref:Pilus assembly protein PilW n=2 Tax=Unclassified Bacteria TaxID=49928 RepID=A0AAU6UU11_UNCXX|nr:pilus assembly protein PilW [Vibrio metschnikovii]EKO3720963.1 pilus assembly protein PilW [Vibrio metschnikovii]EKO3724991.1 pilus assembly protein PilW [Vibrio metschnikovii]EKO3879957.1 pilus assembly protein PilW [Vibrio metschnikovii]EKO3939686.1 pilus assembly protein PilW [Vibrio metschnikovii]
MAFQRAKYRQSGASLVEFMIASLVGSIALAIIGSLFLSNQRVALQRSQEIMLQQQMSKVMHQLKRDVLRAGYNGINNQSLTFSDQDDLLAVTETSIGYVYYTPNSSSRKFSHTLYRLDDKMLKYCQVNSEQLKTLQSVNSQPCYNLFEPKQIKVTNFAVKHVPLSGETVRSAVVLVDVSASLVANPEVTHSMQLQITQRNWQS